MNEKEIDDQELAKWDPEFIKQLGGVVAPVVKRWFRTEVRGLENVPPVGGALMVSNHSGGVLTPDVLVLGPAFYDKFGYDRPLYTLAHYFIFFTPFRGYLSRLGVVHASRDKAAEALHSGAVVLAFPGGDYDAFRPTLTQNVIDFDGRTGYVRTAIEAPWHLAGQARGPYPPAGGDHAGHDRCPIRHECVLPGQFSVADQDRLSGARADRHRRPVRRGSRRRKGRRARPLGDADRS